jgi:UDP-N-acetylglucosamine/UDP-N-acetylgalactosamine diphosphorylase
MQVCFMKQTSLPCVELEKGHAILMDNPWKVALAPAGNGAVFSDLAAAGIVERLADQGIQYVQVCCSHFHFLVSSVACA